MLTASDDNQSHYGESQMLILFQIFLHFTSIVYILFRRILINLKENNRFNFFYLTLCLSKCVLFNKASTTICANINFSVRVFLCLAKGTNANSNWKIESELNNSKAIKIKWWCVGVGVHLNVLKKSIEESFAMNKIRNSERKKTRIGKNGCFKSTS